MKELKYWLCVLFNLPIKLLIEYHLRRSSKFRIAPNGYTEKQADDIWWKHNTKTEALIEKLKRKKGKRNESQDNIYQR